VKPTGKRKRANNASVKPYVYLSFASDAAFLGAVVIQADSVQAALAKATALGVNPGGQVLGMVSPDPHWKPNPAAVDTLLSRADIERLLPELGCSRLGDRRDELSDAVQTICENCNQP
jgi:hypothetical protein